MLGSLLALALTASTAFAVEDRIRHLSGTTFADGGKEYAYLQWTSPDPLTLGDAAFAIYTKPGAPNSPIPFSVAGTIQLQTNPTILDAILADLPATVFEPNDANALINEMFGAVVPAGPSSVTDGAVVSSSVTMPPMRNGSRSSIAALVSVSVR